VSLSPFAQLRCYLHWADVDHLLCGRYPPSLLPRAHVPLPLDSPLLQHLASFEESLRLMRPNEKLAAYITTKYQPKRKLHDIEEIEIADVLLIYDNDGGDRQQNRAQFDPHLRRLNEFWGNKKLAEVTGESCREYAGRRGSSGACAGTSKIFEPRSTVVQKKAFTEVSFAWCCRKRGCPAIDG
jgi:hypothetical protein